MAFALVGAVEVLGFAGRALDGAGLPPERAQALLGFYEALLEPGNLPALDRALRGLWRCPAGLIQRAENAMALPDAPLSPAFAEALSVPVPPEEDIPPLCRRWRRFCPGCAGKSPCA